MNLEITDDEREWLLKSICGPLDSKSRQLGKGLTAEGLLAFRDRVHALKPARPYVPSHGERE